MCVGIPGRFVDVDAEQPEFGTVEVDGARRKVSLALLDGEPPRTGEWLLIQLGFAMDRMTAEEADEATRLLRALSSETADELLADLEAMAVAARPGGGAPSRPAERQPTPSGCAPSP